MIGLYVAIFLSFLQKVFPLLSRSPCSVYLFSTFSINHGLHPWSIKLNPFGIRCKSLLQPPHQSLNPPAPLEREQERAPINHSNASVNLHQFLSIHLSLYFPGLALQYPLLLTDPSICLHDYSQVSFCVAAMMCSHFGW